MKQDFSFSTSIYKNIFKWCVSFLISFGVILGFIFILTFAQKQFHFDDQIIKTILLVLVSVGAGVCSFAFCILSGIKGYLCGLITAMIYSIVKLLMSISSVGVGKDNFLVYICVFSASLIGGILSANRKKKIKW